MDPKQSFQKLSVIRGSRFDTDFSEYLSGSGTQKLRTAFRERKYTVNQVGLPYRLINNWEEQGILPDTLREDTSEWRKFTYIEAVWLAVVMRLRKFGLPLSVIVRVKSCVFEWDEKARAYPLFEYYFLRAVENDADQYVVYLPESGAGLLSVRELELFKVLSKEQDFLLISLKSVARSMGHSVAESVLSLTLSDAEGEVISNARSARTKEIRATVSKGHIVEVEDTKTYPDASLLGEIRKSMSAAGEFGEITTKMESGKTQSVSVKRKQRFKK